MKRAHMAPKPWNPEEGAPLGGLGSECPNRRLLRREPKFKFCACAERCAVCGFGPHYAVHMHAFGGKPGDAPYDHAFVPLQRTRGLAQPSERREG